MPLRGAMHGSQVNAVVLPLSSAQVMAFGDSLTAGANANNGGYRKQIFHDAIANSRTLPNFVGSRNNGPATVDSVTFSTKHEGYPGYAIVDITDDHGTFLNGITGLVTTVLNGARPDVVLLMIGTNDVNGPADLTNAPTRYGTLIDAILTDTHAPAHLICATIPPNASGGTYDTRAQAYNTGIQAQVATRVAAAKPISIVDVYTAVKSISGWPTGVYSAGDDIHLADATGYAVVGDTFYSELLRLGLV